MRFEKEIVLNAPANEVFSFHERMGALKRLSPPWQNIDVVWENGGIMPGGEVKMNIFDPIKIPWLARHIEYEKDIFFSDIQLSGPFSSWVHNHFFETLTDGATLMKDQIDFELPLSGITKILDPLIIKKLNRIFLYRHKILKRDMEINMKYPEKKTILISGGSGVLGQLLFHRLSTAGHDVRFLVRRKPRSENEFKWNPSKWYIDENALKGTDVVINLSGEPIGEGWWTKKKKERIEKSRTLTASLIAKKISEMENPPGLFISSSATGFYGNRKDEILSEESKKGDLFISEICDKWEKAALSFQNKKTRTVILRTGVVLSPMGGALPILLRSAYSGFAAIPGNGSQYISWISSEDWINSVYSIIFDENIKGRVNAVAPSPVTMEEFMKTLCMVVKRPLYFKIPGFLFSLFTGEKGYETIICGARVMPEKLIENRFTFFHETLEPALREMLGREDF